MLQQSSCNLAILDDSTHMGKWMLRNCVSIGGSGSDVVHSQNLGDDINRLAGCALYFYDPTHCSTLLGNIQTHETKIIIS